MIEQNKMASKSAKSDESNRRSFGYIKSLCEKYLLNKKPVTEFNFSKSMAELRNSRKNNYTDKTAVIDFLFASYVKASQNIERNQIPAHPQKDF